MAVGKEGRGEARQGRSAISVGDQDSRAKLRTGDLSKQASVVWAAGSRITTQQEASWQGEAKATVSVWLFWFTLR